METSAPGFMSARFVPSITLTNNFEFCVNLQEFRMMTILNYFKPSARVFVSILFAFNSKFKLQNLELQFLFPPVSGLQSLAFCPSVLRPVPCTLKGINTFSLFLFFLAGLPGHPSQSASIVGSRNRNPPWFRRLQQTGGRTRPCNGYNAWP